jgi:hypothetical protein
MERNAGSATQRTAPSSLRSWYAVASGDEATFFRAFWKIPGQSLDDAEGIFAAAVNSLSL